MPRTSDDTEAPFGGKKRDWTTLYRAIVVILSLFTAGGVGIFIYAGGSFVRAEAATAARSEVAPVTERLTPIEKIPPRIQRLEELSADRQRFLEDINQWRRTKDEIDTRLLIILENQQKQLDRQQVLIDQLATAARK